MFIHTHVHKDGTPVSNEAREKIEKMKELMGQHPEGLENSIASREDAKVMGPERHGRVRGCGFGPTPNSLFGASSSNAGHSNSDADERIKLLEHQLQEKDNVMKEMQHCLNENNKQMERFRAMMEQFSGQVIEQGGPEVHTSHSQPSDK